MQKELMHTWTKATCFTFASVLVISKHSYVSKVQFERLKSVIIILPFSPSNQLKWHLYLADTQHMHLYLKSTEKLHTDDLNFDAACTLG
jgi:hypothetical protein